MALQSKIAGGVSNALADVDTGNNLKVTLPSDHDFAGYAVQINDNDNGELTGQKFFYSPEVDTDYRQRVSQDLVLDEEVFNYTAQNTGKHSNTLGTFTSAFTAGNYTTNASNLNTTNSHSILATHATFPNTGTQTLSCDVELGFSQQPNTNTFVEWGFGINAGSATPPSDGCFFRLSSAGLQGVLSNNGTETTTGVFPLTNGTGTWVYQNNKKYQFICYLGGVAAYFWVNDGTGARLLGSIPLPTAQGRLVLSSGLPFFLKHRITGGAAGVNTFQAQLGAYNIRLGGSNITTTLSTQGNRIYGSYQGQSGGTMGSLANYANSTNPTPAVPTNTTAALGTGLGGQFWETATLALNTDGIICSYQVPTASGNQGRRLVISGVSLSSYIQTAIVGAPFISQYSLAWGHPSVSLANTESVTSRAPRRIALPFNQSITSAQAASTLVAQSTTFLDLGDAPIFVEAGQFIQLVTKHVGTVATAGVIAHTVTFVYGWE